jgi:hypothetical protein
MKELYGLAKAWRTELRSEASPGLSLNAQLLRELDSVSSVLESLGRTLDAHAREHYLVCLQLYDTFATEYNNYVAEHYEASALSDKKLCHKLRKA